MSADESERDLSGADRELETALSSLAPNRDSGLDPIAAAFEAGRRQSHRALRVWRSASFLSGALAAAILIVAGGRINAVPEPSRPLAGPLAMTANVPPRIERPSDESVLRLQQVVLERGVEALPAARALSVRSLSVRGVL